MKKSQLDAIGVDSSTGSGKITSETHKYLPEDVPPVNNTWTNKMPAITLATEATLHLDMVKALESPFDISKDVIANPNNLRLLHSAIGICTEAGELLDMLKKVLFAGKQIDRTNAIEEFGDVLWYLVLGLDEIGSNLQEALFINRKKLALRHGSKFNITAAGDYASRDLGAERKLLEDSTKKV